MKFKVILYTTGSDPTPQASFSFYTFNSALLICQQWVNTGDTTARAYLWDGSIWRFYQP